MLLPGGGEYDSSFLSDNSITSYSFASNTDARPTTAKLSTAAARGKVFPSSSLPTSQAMTWHQRFDKPVHGTKCGDNRQQNTSSNTSGARSHVISWGLIGAYDLWSNITALLPISYYFVTNI